MSMGEVSERDPRALPIRCLRCGMPDFKCESVGNQLFVICKDCGRIMAWKSITQRKMRIIVEGGQ